MSDDLRAELVVDALNMAGARRRPEADGQPRRLLHDAVAECFVATTRRHSTLGMLSACAVLEDQSLLIR
jgi:hypothetical protein